MAWTGLKLTVDGRNALNQAQTENRLRIKSIVVGDGVAPNNFQTRKNLVHQLYEITDIKVDMTESGCSITADFPRLENDYYFREVGVVVSTQEGDKLYVYDNCGDDAQFIVASTGVENTQKRIRLFLMISDVAEITIEQPSLLYVSYEDLAREAEMLKHDLGEHLAREAEMLKHDLGEHLADQENPHGTTKEQVGLENVDNTADADKPVSTAQLAALMEQYAQLTAYIDKAIADLIGGAPSTLDTLKEIADAMADNQGVVDALNRAVGLKANQTELDQVVKDVRQLNTDLGNANTAISKKQDAATAITTGNIGQQSVNYATSAGSATDVSNIVHGSIVISLSNSVANVAPSAFGLSGRPLALTLTPCSNEITGSLIYAFGSSTSENIRIYAPGTSITGNVRMSYFAHKSYG